MQCAGCLQPTRPRKAGELCDIEEYGKQFGRHLTGTAAEGDGVPRKLCHGQREGDPEGRVCKGERNPEREDDAPSGGETKEGRPSYRWEAEKRI